MDYSPPGSSVRGILQTRILEWVAIPFSRGPSWPRDRTWVSHITGRYLTVWATRAACLQYANHQAQNHTSSIWSLYLRRQYSSIFIILGQVPGNSRLSLFHRLLKVFRPTNSKLFLLPCLSRGNPNKGHSLRTLVFCLLTTLVLFHMAL